MLKKIKFTESEIEILNACLTQLINGFQMKLAIKDLSKEQVNNYQYSINELSSLRDKIGGH